jgi:hypothetical protein
MSLSEPLFQDERVRHQWLITVILATQEAEIRRLEFQSQHGQIAPETLSRKKSIQKRFGGAA